MNIKHKKVVSTWYEVDLGVGSRGLDRAIDEFLDGAPDLSTDEDLSSELWEDNTMVLRDFEGDFEGIIIYHTDVSAPVIKFICEKIDVNYDSVKNIDFKLV